MQWYDCAIIQVSTNEILRKKNDTDINDLPDSILESANNYQNYNIGKPSKRTKVNISQINQTLKHLCFRNNVIFVEHKNIGFDF